MYLVKIFSFEYLLFSLSIAIGLTPRYYISQISIPWDNVDTEDILKPKNWSAESVGKFIFYIFKANIKVILLTSAIMIFALFIPYSKINGTLGFVPMPISYFVWVVLILTGYFFTIIFAKKYFIKKFNSWL